MVDSMHKDTAEKVTKARQKQINTHNKRTNIIEPSFHVGDFVVVRRAQGKGHKLNFRWTGPRRIIKVYSDLIYDVEKITDRSVEKVHCARLRLYRHNLEDTPVSKELLDLADRSEAQYEIVEKIVDIGETPDGLFLQIQWLGLPDSTDKTWVSLQTIFEDMPNIVREFLQTHKGKAELIGRAKQSTNLNS